LLLLLRALCRKRLLAVGYWLVAQSLSGFAAMAKMCAAAILAISGEWRRQKFPSVIADVIVCEW
jgi:hypothetical protein